MSQFYDSVTLVSYRPLRFRSQIFSDHIMETPPSSHQPLFGHNLPSTDLVEQKNDAAMILKNQQAATTTKNTTVNNNNSKPTPPPPLESPEITAQQALAIGKAHGLQPFDVICGKCSLAFNNVGNRRFRVVIGMNVQRYIDAPTRSAKSQVIRSVVKLFQEDIGATFVKQNVDGKFVPVSDKIVRQKVGHALRDHAAFHLGIGMQSRSSSPSRQTTRINRGRGHGPKSGTSTCSNASSSADSISEKSSSSAPVKGVATKQQPILPISNISSLGGVAGTRTSNQRTSNAMMMDDTAWADDLSIGSIDHPFLVRPSFELLFPGSIEYSSEEILAPRPAPPLSASLLPDRPRSFHAPANDSILTVNNDRSLDDNATMDDEMIMDDLL